MMRRDSLLPGGIPSGNSGGMTVQTPSRCWKRWITSRTCGIAPRRSRSQLSSRLRPRESTRSRQAPSNRSSRKRVRSILAKSSPRECLRTPRIMCQTPRRFPQLTWMGSKTNRAPRRSSLPASLCRKCLNRYLMTIFLEAKCRKTAKSPKSST